MADAFAETWIQKCMHMQPGSKQTQRQKANATSGTMEQPSPDGSHDYIRQVAGIGGEEMK